LENALKPSEPIRAPVVSNIARSRCNAGLFARLTMSLVVLCTTNFSSAATSTELRGFALDAGAGVVLFAPCAGSAPVRQSLQLEDKTPAEALSTGMVAVRQIMHDPSRPLYVEFRGQVSQGVATAIQFQRASGQISSCKLAQQDAAPISRLLASGENPPWRFVATATSARLEVPGNKPVRFPAAAFSSPTIAGQNRIFDAWSAQDGGTIRIEIAEQMCSDGRSETAYGARVVARFGSQSFEGCAARF
jgi:uncharacterized membrane protein